MSRRKLLITKKELLKSQNEFRRQVNEAFFGDKVKVVNKLKMIDNARVNLALANPSRKGILKNIY